MRTLWLGRVGYEPAWRLQRELAALRADGRIGDTLLLLEHPPTITMGRGTDPAHLLASPDALSSAAIAVHVVDRGGDITYHGPGQLVGYPVVRLTDYRPDLHWFLREIEEALIRALACFGIEGSRFAPHTGVWVGREKVAAIGIKVARWVSTHGFALNVAPDLSHFGLIVPCGISHYGVTSLSRLLGRPMAVEDALDHVARQMMASFAGPDASDVPAGSLSDASSAIVAAAPRRW